MPASTVSITANPAAATRRRSVLSRKKKNSNVELVNHAVISPLVEHSAGSSTPGDDDEIAAGSSKDLIHSIKREKVLEKSKDMVQIKKRLEPNSTVSPRRTRKLATSKPDKTLWQTILSVFAKNFLLLLVLVGLVQMVRKLVNNFSSDDSVNLIGFSDMEGRIADVESYIKKTTTMLQVQVEAVDKKMEGEVWNLRGEMNKKFEENNADLAFRLKTLDEKNEFIEKALDQITSKDLLSKEDFTRFYEEFRKSKIDSGHSEDLSLDEIRALARQIVEKEIEKHAADGLGRVDYALATGGAMVVKHSEPLVVGKDWIARNPFLMTSRQGVHDDAEKMLKPSFGEPGQCFPLKGNSGFVQIKLRTTINPEAVTLEHVAKSVAYDRSSAPRDCQVYGWLQGARGLDTGVSVDNDKMLLTEFTYDLDKSNAQTYNVFDSASSAVVDTIRFEFTSNHGSPSHTCIYRVRVHGHEPTSLSHLDSVFH